MTELLKDTKHRAASLRQQSYLLSPRRRVFTQGDVEVFVCPFICSSVTSLLMQFG